MSVGAVRCLAEAWVWPEVLALRGSGHIREGKALLITYGALRRRAFNH